LHPHANILPNPKFNLHMQKKKKCEGNTGS
jgi:hypothetical protein